MRQVNIDMLEALKGSRCKNVSSNTQVQHGGDGHSKVVLHRTIIFYCLENLTFNHGGWLSNVTFDRLQAIANMYGFTMHRDGNGFYIQTPHDIVKLPCTLTTDGQRA